jgi:hypothetical protein
VEGFEPSADGFGDRCSTRLSYTPTLDNETLDGNSVLAHVSAVPPVAEIPNPRVLIVRIPERVGKPVDGELLHTRHHD